MFNFATLTLRLRQRANIGSFFVVFFCFIEMLQRVGLLPIEPLELDHTSIDLS